jgi:transposase
VGVAVIDWYDLMPYKEARKRIASERCRRIARAYEAGASQAEIARRLGLSRGSVYQLVEKGRRYQQWLASPYRGKDTFDPATLSDRKRKGLLRAVEGILDGAGRDWLLVASPRFRD